MTESDSLSDRLRAALEAVEAAGVPEDLREIAFTRALEVTLGPVVPIAPVPPGQSPIGTHAPAPELTPPADAGSQIARLASKLGIDVPTAAKVYDIDSDGLHLLLSPKKFDDKVTGAMQQIARLIVAGRQAAGLDEEWTKLKEVRAACENRGKYDGSNFSTYIKKLDGDGFRLKGTGQSRELKANASGFEKTGELVKELAAQE